MGSAGRLGENFEEFSLVKTSYAKANFLRSEGLNLYFFRKCHYKESQKQSSSAGVARFLPTKGLYWVLKWYERGIKFSKNSHFFQLKNVPVSGQQKPQSSHHPKQPFIKRGELFGGDDNLTHFIETLDSLIQEERRHEQSGFIELE